MGRVCLTFITEAICHIKCTAKATYPKAAHKKRMELLSRKLAHTAVQLKQNKTTIVNKTTMTHLIKWITWINLTKYTARL